MFRLYAPNLKVEYSLRWTHHFVQVAGHQVNALPSHGDPGAHTAQVLHLALDVLTQDI